MGSPVLRFSGSGSPQNQLERHPREKHLVLFSARTALKYFSSNSAVAALSKGDVTKPNGFLRRTTAWTGNTGCGDAHNAGGF
jgi:hypothetical protein